jgi:hypothetical protein
MVRNAARNLLSREPNAEHMLSLLSELAINPDTFSLLGPPVSQKGHHVVANQNVAADSATVQFYYSRVDTT